MTVVTISLALVVLAAMTGLQSLGNLLGTHVSDPADAVASPNGLLVAMPWCYTTGPWGRDYGEVDVELALLPVISEKVYVGDDSGPPDVVWDGSFSLEVNGKSATVLGRTVQDFAGN